MQVKFCSCFIVVLMTLCLAICERAHHKSHKNRYNRHENNFLEYCEWICDGEPSVHENKSYYSQPPLPPLLGMPVLSSELDLGIGVDNGSENSGPISSGVLGKGGNGNGNVFISGELLEGKFDNDGLDSEPLDENIGIEYEIVKLLDIPNGGLELQGVDGEFNSNTNKGGDYEFDEVVGLSSPLAELLGNNGDEETGIGEGEGDNGVNIDGGIGNGGAANGGNGDGQIIIYDGQISGNGNSTVGNGTKINGTGVGANVILDLGQGGLGFGGQGGELIGNTDGIGGTGLGIVENDITNNNVPAELGFEARAGRIGNQINDSLVQTEKNDSRVVGNGSNIIAGIGQESGGPFNRSLNGIVFRGLGIGIGESQNNSGVFAHRMAQTTHGKYTKQRNQAIKGAQNILAKTKGHKKFGHHAHSLREMNKNLKNKFPHGKMYNQIFKDGKKIRHKGQKSSLKNKSHKFNREQKNSKVKHNRITHNSHKERHS